jgi:SAM-dependent methyltransferase
MSVFNSYARYYDLLYRDKDYYGESNFVHQLIQTHTSNAHDILELGCGTGIHAIELAKQGYKIQGVDFSDKMLEQANDRLCALPPDLASRLKFHHGDIRQIRLHQKFDVVISLFHVICYQTTNEDLLAAFATVREHLKSGGIFIFDVWYGPAVLSDRPTVRVKRLEDEHIQVTRVAQPVMYPNENWVDVNYQVFIKDKNSHAVDELWETHRMRYLFKPEIELLFQKFQMQIIAFREWMSTQEAGFNTWSTYFVGKG